ncbi:MAG TPA: NrfD/PsrC family molybdoenzyme membrane anchor subunit [Bryobacteraceae bacterium]|nr:NrfD/PsrC family molybdoenzyme membrane anchor subunit [Bryobacteraceae bacterium]
METVLSDGRDIDTKIATLTGEASHQLTPAPHQPGVWETMPGAQRTDPTYYDRPMLKPSVWKPYIPAYYFVGGAAGASLALGAAAQLDGSHELDDLIQRCHWTGIIGSSIAAVLLISDLGRPSRFLFMLRVFRPTSPMNMGAWILAVAPSAAVTAGLFARRTNGILQRLGEVAGYTSGIFGLALATYTGVLVANTAVPIWQECRRVLPILFGASAVASAGSIFDLLVEGSRTQRITYSFGLAGRVAELTAGLAMERVASRVPSVGRPLKRGFSGFLWRAATILTAGSIVAMLWPGQKRRTREIAGILGLGGSLLMRFAVDEAGKASALDPRASFHQQRSDLSNLD